MKTLIPGHSIDTDGPQNSALGHLNLASELVPNLNIYKKNILVLFKVFHEKLLTNYNLLIYLKYFHQTLEILGLFYVGKKMFLLKIVKFQKQILFER